MKKITLTLLTILLFGCNDPLPYNEPLSPENENIIENFRIAILKNKTIIDSITDVYNVEYSYTIPIEVYINRYSPYNYFFTDFEGFITDVPYYGMVNSDTTQGFIFSLHQQNKKIDIIIYRGYKRYVGYDDEYTYTIIFK